MARLARDTQLGHSTVELVRVRVVSRLTGNAVAHDAVGVPACVVRFGIRWLEKSVVSWDEAFASQVVHERELIQLVAPVAAHPVRLIVM
jgi:hypothetical protein